MIQEFSRSPLGWLKMQDDSIKRERLGGVKISRAVNALLVKLSRYEIVL